MSEIAKKKNTITRSIELWIDEEDLETRKAARDKLWKWQDANMRIHNTIACHLYIQKNMQELAYFNKEFKANNPEIFSQAAELPDGKKERGFSPANRTYRIVSETYGGGMPSDIISNINSRMTSTFAKEADEYYRGERSLRTHKKNSPIPFSAKMITDIRLSEDKKEYHFTLFGKKHGVKFKTRFGRDTSKNKEHFEMCLDPNGKLLTGIVGGPDWPIGAYKLCDSSFRIDGAKIFLLAVFQAESTKSNLIEGSVMEAHLSVTVPIALRFKGKTFSVGDRKEFLHRRIAIAASLQRAQIAARFNNGGNGDNSKHGTHRRKKLKTIEDFKDYEKNFVISKHHKYSKKVIDLCLKHKCEELVLKYTHEIECPKELTGKEKNVWHEENEYILRNWTYYGLTEKFKYKCKKVGIKLTVEKKVQETK